VCRLATPAAGTSPLPAGSLAPTPEFQPPGTWRWYEDGSGFRMAFPSGWTRFRPNVCFGDERDRRYVSVGQWRQPDTDLDLVAYWTRKESEVMSGLSGYHRLDLKPYPNYRTAAARWEFTFDDGGEAMHVGAIAFVAPGGRGYGFLWATPDAIWENNVTDFSRLSASFQPAA
jgi:eukaryotic-like serine/threonine-protein kinase